jgi:hypothetical protein
VNAVSLLLALACLYCTVIAARDLWSWFDTRYWTAHLPEIVGTAIIAIFLFAACVIFFIAGIGGLPQEVR